MRFRSVIVGILVFVVGFSCGAYLFSGVKLRSIIAIDRCETGCFDPKDIIGLLTSIGIQKLPSSLLPSVVYETKHAIAVKHPNPERPFHVVIFPKKDILHLGDVGTDDMVYLEEVFGIMSYLIEKYQLKKYRVISNGPGYQDTTYLHFHLMAAEFVGAY